MTSRTSTGIQAVVSQLRTNPDIRRRQVEEILQQLRSGALKPNEAAQEAFRHGVIAMKRAMEPSASPVGRSLALDDALHFFHEAIEQDGPIPLAVENIVRIATYRGLQPEKREQQPLRPAGADLFEDGGE